MDNCKWYRCKKCGKITTFNFKDRCNIPKCDGALERIDNMQLLMEDNHYYNFYKSRYSNYLKKLLIKEHTAQLSKQDSRNYQMEFERNSINALSCSTTFEMGVDVGELETVLLRDIPPSAANYAQRAGRAGRSSNSAAFVLSYAKLSSHDFNYYQNPIDMIKGTILPPSFKLDNKKIYFRHIYSTIFGYFFNKYPEHFFDPEKKVQRKIDYFVNIVIPEIIKLVNNPPEELTRLIKLSFSDLPDVMLGESFNLEWVNDLIGNDGRLTNAKREYDETIEEFKMQKKLLIENEPDNWESAIERLSKKEKRYKGIKIIDFLITYNILPKYGFPVDTVELKLNNDDFYNHNNDTGLRLNRDLTQAISDYAPGSKVIANNRMYTSRYISKYWKNGQKDFDKVYVKKCPSCETLNISQVEPPLSSFNCFGCNHDIKDNFGWIEAIIPTAGMISNDKKGELVPLTRPKRIYRSDYFFVEEDFNSNKVVLDVGNEKITLISSKRDTIGVTSSLQDPFYVCDSCGFAYGKSEKIKYKQGSKYFIDKEAMEGMSKNKLFILTKEKHKKPNGDECNCNKLDRKILCHSFNTDIVQIIFNNRTFSSYKEAISVLFALIDATSLTLNVERKEIGGTIVSSFDNTNTNFKFILFDNVPGGAGFVKKISEDNYINLYNIIIKAYEKTINCECDKSTSCYKCLRTYENQIFHEDLSREYVFKFLEPCYKIYPKTHSTPTLVVSGGESTQSFSSWDELNRIKKLNIYQETIDYLISERIPLPDYINCNIHINEKLLSVSSVCYWKEKQIFLFPNNDSEIIREEKNADDFYFFVDNVTFNPIKFRNLFTK